MWIKNIKMSNFRNYSFQDINLKQNANIFFGENAQGKTNIIESIFLCSIGKSFRAKKDNEMIKIDSSEAVIEVQYEKEDREGKIRIVLSDKKNIFLNDIKIKKISEMLGKINIVIFTPDDIDILKGGPQYRRKFLDIMISQLRPNYLYNLNLYMQVLQQRNNYLRQIKLENKPENMLEIWDEKLADYAEKIANYRREFIEKIKEKIEKIHNEITEEKEKIEIEYITECIQKEKFLKSLKDRRKVDIIRGFTTLGIHRDDFKVSINGKEIQIYGSQGQHRTAILSLKLSELQIIYDEIGENPILLLDDFMSELDEKRREKLLKNIKNTQVIITCTDKIDIDDLECSLYNVNQGNVIEIAD